MLATGCLSGPMFQFQYRYAHTVLLRNFLIKFAPEVMFAETK